MLWNAKNGELKVAAGTMDYVSFGEGEQVLVMIPGLGDGLKTVRGTAAAMAANYRKLAEAYTVYIFSRVRELTEGYTTRRMARDLAEGLEQLGIREANILGISQGGMIAQWLAIDHPELVRRLVLTVTAARANEISRECLSRWLAFAGQEDYRGLIVDTAECSYTEKYLSRVRAAYPLLAGMGRPQSFSRFTLQAISCLEHDAHAELHRIQAPTLVIGGGQDRIVGAEASRELAERIPRSLLYLYEDYGHGLYDEEKGSWLTLVRRFLEK